MHLGRKAGVRDGAGGRTDGGIKRAGAQVKWSLLLTCAEAQMLAGK